VSPRGPRLDVVLVERGLAESRSRAQALVMAGRVLVDGAPVTKAGTPVGAAADVEVTLPARYVSRGGEKLATALEAFSLDVSGELCLDAGASTGGFTDCLLQAGAEHVVAADVGRGQLHERLARDPRVTVLDGVNVRELEPGMLPYRPSFVTADLSFISLRLVLPALVRCAAPSWRGVVLVKPQFEAGRDRVRGGVVRDPAVRAQAIAAVAAAATAEGAVILGVCDSLHPGPAGNREYPLGLASPDHGAAGARANVDVEDQINRAVGGP
jgi:23S rRNA (cytidine1920-2'-O)/16S rRNA (cytidine1409-2'-O)-methyltransferase